MRNHVLTALVVGATGSIRRIVVAEAVKKGHAVRALARDPGKGRRLFLDVEVVAGDLTRPDMLTAAVDGVDAIVFTHGSDEGGKTGPERVDYGGVRSVLAALDGRSVRIALMTPSAWCAPADCRTRSCDPAGSTTTSQTNIGWSCSRAIAATRAIPAMASSRDASSPRFWSPA
jgi:nucleoside-diphosphate-sugar epimerase